jgi:hypothetical protein
MRTQLEGYKGNLRKFIAPVSESKFNADKFHFTDTSGSNLPYRMNNIVGHATRYQDVMSLGAMVDYMSEKIKEYTFSDISTSTSEYQEFNIGSLWNVSKYKLRNGSIKLFVNRVLQIAKPPFISTTGVDYYLLDSYKKLRIRKRYVNEIGGKIMGVTLESGDEIIFKYRIQPIQLV